MGLAALEGSSAYLIAELESLRDEPAVLTAFPAQPRGLDVVERQLALMADAIRRIRDLRRFVSDAVASLPDATFVTDTEGRIVLRSAAAERLSGRLDASGVDHGSIDALLSKLKPAEALHEPTGAAEPQDRELITEDGSTYREARAPILDHLGGLAGWTVRLTDLTAIREAQRQREELLQLLSHDMRSPQASIIAQLDQEPAEGVSAGGARRIRMLARRTLALADGFVQLARAEAGPLSLETLDLHDLLSEAIDEVWPQTAAHKIAITAPDADEPELIHGDGGLIRRALVNLIGNAVRHSPAGGVVKCILTAGPDMLVCSISDQGEGLDQDALSRLFQRFRPGSAPSGGGVGLGLAFAQMVAHRHGGRIDCVSQRGQGATFILRLPVAPKELV